LKYFLKVFYTTVVR